jgi:hypothetical protein
MNPNDYNNFTASPNNPIIEGGADAPKLIDMATLVPVIQEWRRIHEELDELNQQARERKKRVKVLDGVIMEKMKMGNIGALNLKNGQILYKKKETKEGLTPKTVQKLLTEHFQDEAAAAEAMKYLLENRESRIKEKIQYEK